MNPSFQVALFALCLSATPTAAGGGGSVRLKEARIAAEFTAGSGEVALVVSAEGETGFDRVEIRDPFGAVVAGLASANAGRNHGLYGFRLEVGETDRASFFSSYPAGLYEI